ncbi:MAG: peptidylprolyl isomerase [Bdellovibrionota bacterium]
MNQIFASLLVITSMLFLSSTSFAQKSEEVLFTVGNKKVTLQEFTTKFNDVRSKTTVNPPTKKQFLEDLVRFEVGAQEAEKRKMDKDPIVQDRLRQELYKALLEKELGQKVQTLPVSEKEMVEWYKKNPEIRLSHILIELKPAATAEQRAEALKRSNEILDEVKKSKRTFEDLVKIYSDDPLSKSTGGDVGWQSRDTIMPNMYEAAVTGKVGEVKGLLETQFGFHVIKVTGRRSYENANKRHIRLAVFNDKRKQVFDSYFDKLKKTYTIKTNPSLIE